MNNKYPDSEPDGLGDLKKIERLPSMKKQVPSIRWGIEYLSWPIQKRLDYAEALASSMNHAADILQQERNKLIIICKHQEEQLEHATKVYVTQGEMTHRELTAQDAEKQKLYQEIVSLKKQLKVFNGR